MGDEIWSGPILKEQKQLQNINYLCYLKRKIVTKNQLFGRHFESLFIFRFIKIYQNTDYNR